MCCQLLPSLGVDLASSQKNPYPYSYRCKKKIEEVELRKTCKEAKKKIENNLVFVVHKYH